MKITKKQLFGILAGIGGIFFIVLLFNLGVDVKNQHTVIVQAPFTGKMSYYTTPGFRMTWLGRVTTYEKRAQLWFSDLDGEGGEGFNDLSISITFNDGSKSNISGSLSVKLPTDERQLALIQQDYPGMDKLMTELVRPVTVKAISATGPLLSAFESYAAKRNDMIGWVTDQMNNGVYRTRTTEQKVFDELTQQDKVVRVAEVIRQEGQPEGIARQEQSPFSKYGIEVSQLSISGIEYPDPVILQIRTQQEAIMAVQTAKAEALKAEQDVIKAEAEGKARAETAKWTQEEIKIVEVTKAQQSLEVATLAAQEAVQNALRVKAEGDAEAHRQRALVSAGLSPKERAEYDMKTKIGVAAELAKWKPPTIVIGGGGSGSPSIMDPLMINQFLGVVEKLNK